MKKSGFTVAEVLITLGIIGIVSALTIVALNKFDRISDAEVMTSQEVCSSMIKTIGEKNIINVIKSNKKILDIASKKAEFILAIVKLLQENGLTPDDYKDLLYSIPTSKIAYEFTRKMYEILDLNIQNISYNTSSYDMLKIKNGEKVDYEKISSYINNCKKPPDLGAVGSGEKNMCLGHRCWRHINQNKSQYKTRIPLAHALANRVGQS